VTYRNKQAEISRVYVRWNHVSYKVRLVTKSGDLGTLERDVYGDHHLLGASVTPDKWEDVLPEHWDPPTPANLKFCPDCNEDVEHLPDNPDDQAHCYCQHADEDGRTNRSRAAECACLCHKPAELVTLPTYSPSQQGWNCPHAEKGLCAECAQ